MSQRALLVHHVYLYYVAYLWCEAKDRTVVRSQLGIGIEEEIVTTNKTEEFCLSDVQVTKIAIVGMRVS